MPFCKHRWTNIKTWIERKTLNVIQRCRWCNSWKRLTLDQEGVDVEVKTVRYKQDEHDKLLNQQIDNQNLRVQPSMTRQHNIVDASTPKNDGEDDEMQHHQV